MASLSPRLQREFEYWESQIRPSDLRVDSSSLSIRDVLRAHFMLAEFFQARGEGIGGVGPRDLQLLNSAVFRQFTSFGNQPKWQDRFEICATLFYGLIKDHPFHDANKRTAFLCALYHLEKIGKCPTVSETEFEDFAVNVAENLIHEKYAGLFYRAAESSSDRDVYLIAAYMKRNTRNIDTQKYNITYRELQTKLRGFGFTLANPNNNHIDLVALARPNKKLAQIGFPSWTTEVGQAALRTIRREAKLDYDSGFDSAAFFNGVDSMKDLINSYQEPLKRLAFR